MSDAVRCTWAHRDVATFLLLWLSPQLMVAFIQRAEPFDVEYAEQNTEPPLSVGEASVMKPLKPQLERKVTKFFNHLLETGKYEELYNWAPSRGATAAPSGYIIREKLFEAFEKFCGERGLRMPYRTGQEAFAKRLMEAGLLVPTTFKSKKLGRIGGLRMFPAEVLCSKLESGY